MQQQDWEERHDRRDIGNALEKLQHGNLFLRILAAAFPALLMPSLAPDRNKDISKRWTAQLHQPAACTYNGFIRYEEHAMDYGTNIESYLGWRGDIPFSVSPFSEIDAIVLCKLCLL
jgi:hypothetical protein